MRIGLTYDLQTDPAQEHQAEFDPPATLDALTQALRQLGHSVVLLGSASTLAEKPAALAGVDLVFNIAEGSRGRCRESWVPVLLEHWGKPFAGSGATTLALALDKAMTKKLVAASSIPTPPWKQVSDPDAVLTGWLPPFPVIVKPCHEGSGLGVGVDSIITDRQALYAQAERLINRFQQPCLVEEFIAFGELTVFLIGNNPPEALPAIQRPLNPQTRLSCHVAGEASPQSWLCPVAITRELDAQARQMAKAVFELLKCRDMARVDFRVDEAGKLYFLEINPLPSFAPDGSLGLLAEYLGTAYAALVGRILDAAVQRIKASGKPAVLNQR